MTLKLETTQGDFVHNNQEMAKGDGFKCVSKIWFDKTKPLDVVLGEMAKDAAIRYDVKIPAEKFNVKLNAAGQACLEVDGKEFEPTNHAWEQLAGQTICNIGTTIVKQLRTPIVKGKEVTHRDQRDAETLVNVFANGHRRLDQKKVFRFRLDQNGKCRAALTEGYTPIDNVWYLETLQSLFKANGGEEPRFSHSRGNSDTLYANILIPDTCIEDTDSDYGGMLSLSNCEIGTRRLTQLPSIFRAICMNGCIWDQVKGSEINKVHRGEINLIDLRKKILDNIKESLPIMPTIIAKFLATKDMKLDKTPVQNMIAQIAIDQKFTPKQSLQIVEEFKKFESSNFNLFGVVNAITRAGQQFDNDTWVQFDEVAGVMVTLNNNQFDRLKNRSNMLTNEDMGKVFGLSV
jgi:hypothetical protein